ncbi:signal recognition particle-docking protein FtsY [Candidatus Woesearchaeota archaeon]|nr:signal recognition particle-docking protein FtsY [Candidatus Woesearchaeota archaeon]
MFGFLKKKLKEAIGRFSKKAEEEAEEIIEEKPKKQDIKEIKKKEVEEKTLEKIKDKKEEKREIKPKEQVKEKKTKKKEIKEKAEEKKEIVEKEPEIKEKPTEEDKKQEPKKESFFSKIFKKKKKEEEFPEKETEIKKEPAEEEPEEVKEEQPEEEPEEDEKKSLFGKISDAFTKVSLSEQKFDELFWDLELALLENNVAVEVIEKIKNDLKNDLVEKKINRKNLNNKIIESLKNSIEDLFNTEKIDLIKKIRQNKPYIIAFIGVNGSGKTTTLAKLIHLLKKNKASVVVGACDTFRAAAIQQLEEHTNKLGVKLIKHDYGADPAAVAYDTVEHAKAKNIDVVLLDTAGRLHSNKNLMDELRKIIKVANPDLNIFIGESIAGNDLVEQVKLFNMEIGIDAIILAKADIDEKGGAAISVSYITNKPILFMGTGQEYDDLEEFSKEKILKQIGLSA